jgi:3-deoxy-7-phosphoheptulonate synthase
MVVVVEKNVSDSNLQKIVEHLEEFGFVVHKSVGVEQVVLGAVGVQPGFDIRQVKILEGVKEVYRITDPYKLASRTFRKENTEIKIGDVVIGGNEVVVIAGPCSVESEEQVFMIAEMVKKSGAKILRGGAFKPRTSPYAFQGMGIKGLEILRKAGDKYNLLVITEVMESTQIPKR